MKKAVSIRAVIPNVITILALCLGLTAIKFTLVQNFHYAVICVTLAAVLDAADGRIARLIKGTSKFGAELDSLVDFVNFGVAPALIIYIWELNMHGNLGWLATLLFVICCCLRLARFNVSSVVTKSPWLENFFTGVPSPAGAGILLLPVILSLSNFSYLLTQMNNVSLFIILITSFLMISKIPTYAFKKFKVTKPIILLVMILSGLVFGFLINYTFETLFVVGILYLLSIPVSFFHYKIIKKKHNLKTNSKDSLISDDLL